MTLLMGYNPVASMFFSASEEITLSFFLSGLVYYISRRVTGEYISCRANSVSKLFASRTSNFFCAKFSHIFEVFDSLI